MKMTYTVSRCPCGHPTCQDWHVEPVAATRGVSFTEKQARAAAAVLNALEDEDPRAGMLALIKWTRDQVNDVLDADWSNGVCDRLDQVSDVLEFRT